MGRGYLNVRATGGAVEPLPWRGLRGLGRRSKPSWQEGWEIEKKKHRDRLLRYTSERFCSHNYIQSEMLALCKKVFDIEIPGAGEDSELCSPEHS